MTEPPLTAVPQAGAAPRAPWSGALFNALLTAEVLLFAFIAASFAARNSDFWQHLAAGRLLAGGEYVFGVDPFAYTSAGTYWVNHAWLSDLGLYAVYQAMGGPALVVGKALLIALLAWFWLRVRRPGTSPALPAACALVALLTMSPRLLLQSTCLSFLFLGVTLWFLWRPHGGGEPPEVAATSGVSALGRLRHYTPLLLLFALWVNTDAWFLLGPALVGLVWLGERLGANARRVTPGLLVPASLAACLLNPHFVRAFVLPAELDPAVWAGELSGDPRFGAFFLSPWQLREYLQPTTGLNAAGLAYFVLVALGVVSFLLGGRHFVGWRIIVWTAFALLGAWQVRLIPFFAVIAAPITALNFQDAAARRGARDERRGAAAGSTSWFSSLVPHLSPLIGRLAPLALAVAGLALPVLAWPGWLQVAPHEHRRVAWRVDADPSLERVGQTLQRWRQERLLADGERVFALHPDVAHYCAWATPGEKSFLDHRFALFAGVATQYEVVCRGLLSGPSAGTDHSQWRDILRAHGISVLVVYDPNLSRLLPAVQRLAQAHEEWQLLQVDGQALIFGWRGGRPDGSFAALELDAQRLAFAPAEEEWRLPRAPALGPGRAPAPRDAYERFLHAAPLPTWESAASSMYLRYFEDRHPLERRQALALYAAGTAGATPLTAPTGPGPLLFRLMHPEPFLPGFTTRRPDFPLLTVRAARRALAANPDDVGAWLRLGQAYLLLHRVTPERSASGNSALLGLLRHVQATAALEHALLLDPDLEAAHEALSVLYSERKYADAALNHRREVVRLTRRGPRAGEDPATFERRLEQEESALRRLEQFVQERRNEYAVRSRAFSGDPLARADLALSLGLAHVALDDVLLQSQVLIFGGEGARLQLELLLMLGRAEAARRMLEDAELRQNRDRLDLVRVVAPPHPGYQRFYRLPAYEWLRFLQSAATGDYEPAALALTELLRPLEEKSRQGLSKARRLMSTVLATEVGAASHQPDILVRLVLRRERVELTHYLTDLDFLAAQRADLDVLGALLGVERGDPLRALDHINTAFKTVSEQGVAGGFASSPLAAALRAEIAAAQAKAGEW